MPLWVLIAMVPTGQTAYTTTHVISEERPLYARVLTGMAVAPEYEGSDELAFLPFVGGRLQYEYRYVQLDGLTARANLLNHPSLEIGPTANLLFGRSPSDIEGPVGQLEEVDAALEVVASSRTRGGGCSQGPISFVSRSVDSSTSTGFTMAGRRSYSPTTRWRWGTIGWSDLKAPLRW